MKSKHTTPNYSTSDYAVLILILFGSLWLCYFINALEVLRQTVGGENANSALIVVSVITSFGLYIFIFETIDSFLYPNNVEGVPFEFESALVVLRNIVILSVPTFFASTFRHTKFSNVNSLYDFMWLCTVTVFWLGLWTICSEIVFYLLHRVAHALPLVYRHVHKMHHRYSITRPLYCQYLSIWEALLINIPTTVGLLFLLPYPPHPYTLVAITSVFTYNNVTGHRSSHVFDGRHALHHRKTMYNFGNFETLDRLFGTEFTEKSI